MRRSPLICRQHMSSVRCRFFARHQLSYHRVLLQLAGVGFEGPKHVKLCTYVVVVGTVTLAAFGSVLWPDKQLPRYRNHAAATLA